MKPSSQKGVILRKVTLALIPNDFQGILAESHGYSEEGLTGRIRHHIVRTFTRQIQEQLAEILVTCVVRVHLAQSLPHAKSSSEGT